MIERYLKAKHWQVFLLTFVLPFVFQIVMTGGLIIQLQPLEYGEAPQFPVNLFLVFGVVMLLYVVFLFSWYWSVVFGLRNKLPEGLKLKYERFKIFFFSPLIYFLVIGFVINYFLGLSQNNEEPNFALLLPIFLIVFLLHFYSMFCMIYIMYFTAKTIKSVELQREAHFSDYVLEFFLVWFLPIGIWILQPKINNFLSDGKGNDKLHDY